MTNGEITEAIRDVRGNATIRVWTGQETLHVSTDGKRRETTRRFRIDYPDRSRDRGTYTDGMSLRYLLLKNEFTVIDR